MDIPYHKVKIASLSYITIIRPLTLSPFHNLRLTALKHFVIVFYSRRTTDRLRCTIDRNRCMYFFDRKLRV